MKRRNLIAASIALTALTALSSCAGKTRHIFPPHQYWQRTHASSALYTRGEKAAQILKRDIQNCVYELEELQRLGEAKSPLNLTYNGRLIPIDPLTIEKQSGSAMLAGNSSYTTFDSCMYAQGWERANNFQTDLGVSPSKLPKRRLRPTDSDLINQAKQTTQAKTSKPLKADPLPYHGNK